MRKTAVITHHTSTQRDSWWYLIQDDDGTLYVEHVDDLNPNHELTRWTINEFICTADRPGRALQKLIDRMFE